MAYLNSNVFPARSEKSKKLSIADRDYKVGVKVPPEYSLDNKDYPVIVFCTEEKMVTPAKTIGYPDRFIFQWKIPIFWLFQPNESGIGILKRCLMFSRI